MSKSTSKIANLAILSVVMTTCELPKIAQLDFLAAMLSAQVVALEVKHLLGIDATYATGLVLSPGAGAAALGTRPLVLTTCPVPPNHGVALALDGQVLEAEVVAQSTVERSTEVGR